MPVPKRRAQCGVCAVIVTMALPAAAQEPAPAAVEAPTPMRLSTQAEQPATPGGRQFGLKDNTPDPQRGRFGGWTTRSETSWTDARGFHWNVSSAGADTTSHTFQPMVATAPEWKFGASATRDGAAGLRFTGRLGARRGYTLPSFLTDVVGRNGTIPVTGTQLIDPSQRQTVWDATVGVERSFEVGRLDVRLVGEALMSFGRTS